MGYKMKLVVELEYDADPAKYSVDDNGDDITAFEMARIDSSNFSDDPEAMTEKLLNDPSTKFTVAPVVTLEY